jgi:hypothetical protein
LWFAGGSGDDGHWTNPVLIEAMRRHREFLGLLPKAPATMGTPCASADGSGRDGGAEPSDEGRRARDEAADLIWVEDDTIGA